MERKFTRRIIKYDKQLDEAVSYFLSNYDTETLLSCDQVPDKKIGHFLKYKLHTPYIHIVFTHPKYFTTSDSLIMFTKTGIPVLGNEHDVVIDFKATACDSLGGPFIKEKKVLPRKYYAVAAMPAF